MFEDMLGMGAGGGELQPAPPGTPPEELTAQWGSFLKNPKTQAAMLTFGLEMMKPRWNSASALPDALGAGVKAVGVMEEDERALMEQRRKEGLASGEASANRSNRLEAARIGADSRADVANIRANAMLEATNQRQQLKGPVYERLRLQYIDSYTKSAQREDALKMNSMEGLTGRVKPRDAAQLRQEAEIWADSQLRSGVGQIFDAGGQGGGGNHQPNIRQNSPTGGAPVRPAPAPGTPKPTSVNSPNPGNEPPVTSRSFINRFLRSSPGNTRAKLEELQGMLRDPAKRAMIDKAGITDGQNLESEINQILSRMK